MKNPVQNWWKVPTQVLLGTVNRFNAKLASKAETISEYSFQGRWHSMAASLALGVLQC